MLKSYMYTHRRGILAFFLMMIAAACIIRLYELPPEAVGYTAAVSGFIGMVFLLEDFMRFRKRTCALETLHREALVSLDGLPEPQNDLEAQYQELLRMEFAEKERLSGEQQDCYRDMMEYYSMWAHQIKTPIAAAQLILQSAQQQGGELSPGDCAELQEEIRRIRQYVEMVMCYLRLDSDASDYVIREYDLDAIIRQALRENASVFIRKKIKLHYEPLQVKVLTDEKWLLFVIGQVLSNALKYTPSGSITISLKAPKTLCVRDTGIGIAPEDLPRIFERGYTGGNGRTDRQASGIGLYLCRRICQNLGHTITAVAHEDGTELQIDLQSEKLEIE